MLCSYFTESVIEPIVHHYVHINENYINTDGHYQTVTWEEQEYVCMCEYVNTMKNIFLL